MNRILLQLMVGLGAVVTLGSCTKDKDLFYSYEEVQKQKYATNFVAKYGAISPNQSWDFSTNESRLATRGYTAINTEIMENGINFGDLSNLQTKDVIFPSNHAWDYIVIEGGVEKNSDLLNAIATELPEKKVWHGQPAILVAPSSSFYIYPLFSGGNIRFNLKVKVGNNDPVTVFEKDYKNFQTINGMTKANGEIVNMKGIKIEAPVGTPVEVYLDNLMSINDTPINGTVGTTNGKAVYVEIPEGIVPELDDVNLDPNAVVKYIGIEDDVSSGSDNDYNDVVLVVVGNPDIPQEKIITNNRYEVKTTFAKRYMIEDLGTIDDFDFNDVVVDVENNTVITHEVTYENGILKTDNIISETTEPTKALIRAMGGTKMFELTIGATTWSKSGAGFDYKTMYNTQSPDFNAVLAEFEVEGWNPDANNIFIKVDGQGGEVYTISFPEEGTAPMIIAVDPTEKWMNERKSFPTDWFNR